MEKRPLESTNDSTHMPPPWKPHTLGRRKKLFNISLGYEVLPFPGPRKIMHKCRPTNLGLPPASKRRLWDIAAPFLSVNHVTETLGKGLGKEQKTLCKRLLALR